MEKKSSAHYQREFRRRLRESGLIKKEVWIRPEHTLKLNAMEHVLRQSEVDMETESHAMAHKQWTSKSLFIELQQTELLTSKQVSVELIDGIDPVLHITMHEYGELPIFLTVIGEQIIVEAVLWSTADVINQNDFNEAILRTHKYFPLSTISLDKQDKGDDYYHMFGALSSASIIINIIFEIETLASNVIKVTEAYCEYLVERG